MAASSMSARSLPKLARFSRSLLFNKPQRRLGVYKLSTTASENKVSADKPPADAETLKNAGEKVENNTTDTAEGSTKETKSDVGPSELEKKLTEENKKLQADFKEIKDKYMRALAETENVRTRMRKQVEDAKVFGIQGFCKDLLDVADILNQATETVPKEELKKSQHLKSLFEGLTMTNKQMVKVFGKHGLVIIDPAVGEKFDPFFHEALFQVPAQDGTKADTIAVIQKSGYKLHERTLRPALVGVFKS